MQPSYSLIWATGSVPDAPALLPCEQEPSGEDDGYSSMRTQRHTTILDMFPHECLRVSLRRKGRSFSLPFAPSQTLTPHIYAHHVSASHATSDKIKRREGSNLGCFTSARSCAMTVLFSLKSGANALRKAGESRSAWVRVYYLIWMKHQDNYSTIFKLLFFCFFFHPPLINTCPSAKSKGIHALCNGWHDY